MTRRQKREYKRIVTWEPKARVIDWYTSAIDAGKRWAQVLREFEK